MRNNRLSPLFALLCLLLVSRFEALAFAEVWNYPQPDPDRDVKDVSFYQKPSWPALLPQVDGGRVRNVILMIGDGMSFNHVAMARRRAVGADGRLYMERFPVAGMLRTHSANRLVTDSAAAATAMASGVKTDNGRIGQTSDGRPWETIMERARNRGYRTGLVATSTLSHATPAGFAAHVENRSMEAEIAAQMIDGRFGVLFGGGRKYWLPKPHGTREDGRNLVEQARRDGYQVIFSGEQLNALTSGPVLGLFADDGMTTYSPEPSLEQMTRKAIELLSARSIEWFAPQPRFFVMVEGSQIDWAAHSNDTDNVIRQTLLFDLAVREAAEFALRDKQTLVIVTADHETGGLLTKADKQIPVAEWHSKDHTAGDVPLFAFGPGANRFAGARDNTEIPVIIAQLLGFGPFPAPLKMHLPIPAEAAGK